MIILRKPNKNEVGVYKKLEVEFYSHHKPYKTLLQDVDPRARDLKKEFLKLISERNSFFRFIKVNDEVAGYIYGILKKVDENEKGWKKIGDLNSIVVLKKFRKQGIAEHMAKEFFRWLKSKNVKYVESSSNLKNELSARFHKRIGFQEQHIKFGRLI